MSHVSDIFFPFGRTLKHKSVCTRGYLHTKKCVVSIADYHFKMMTQIRCLPKHERARDRDDSRFGEQNFPPDFRSLKSKKDLERDLLINPGTQIWKIRPRRTHRAPVQSFSSREIPGENRFPVPSSRLPHWQSDPRNDHVARCTRVVMFSAIAPC